MRKHDRDIGLVVGAKITAFVRRVLHIPKRQKKIAEQEPLLGPAKIVDDEEAAPKGTNAPVKNEAPKLSEVMSYQTTLNLLVYFLLALYSLAYDQVRILKHPISTT